MNSNSTMNRNRAKKKNNLTRMMFIGALTGGFLSGFLPFAHSLTEFFSSRYHINFLLVLEFIILTLTVITLAISFTNYKKLKSNDKQFISDNDQIDFTHIFNSASKNVVYSSVFSILLLALSISTMNLVEEGFIDLTLAFIIPGFILVILTTILNKKVLSFYPLTSNRSFEIDYGNPNLMETIINNVDEGERLIMLHSLNKTYVTITYIAAFSIVLLAIYQNISGQSQLLAMVCFVFMLIYSTYTYYKKLEEYNK